MLALAILSLAIAEPPPAVLVVPEPRVTLPRVRELARLSKAGRRDLERDAAALGFDPLEAASLEALGIDLGAPIYVWLAADAAPVVELAVVKPAVVDAAIARAGKGSRYRVARKESRLFVQLASAGDAMAAVEKAVKPKNAPHAVKARSEPASMWMIARPPDVFDRVEAAIWLSPRKIEAQVELWLDMTTGLIAGDLAGAGGPARRLLPELGGAAEVVARVGAQGLSDLLELPAIDRARGLSGELQGVLTAKGTVVGALGLKRDIGAETAEKLRAALQESAGGQVRVVDRGDEKLIVAELPGADGKLVEKALAQKLAPSKTEASKTDSSKTDSSKADSSRTDSSKTDGSKADSSKADSSKADSSKLEASLDPTAPIQLRLTPPLLFDALAARARSKDGLQLSRSKVAAADVMWSDVAANIKVAALDVALPPGMIEASVRIEY